MKPIKTDLNIVCCSRSRADNLITKKLFIGHKLIVVVPKSQVAKYKEHNTESNLEIVGHPNWVRGIGDARWWVMENYGNVFMLDDDIDHVRNYCVKGKAFDTIRDSDHVNDIIQSTYLTAKALGAKMWGFGNCRQPLEFSPQKPFKFTGYINASMCGYMEDHGLEYKTGTKWLNLAEDFYFSGLNAHRNRFMFADERYTFLTVGNFSSTGGYSDYRTSADLDEATIELMGLFGEAIVYKSPSGTKKKLHQGERVLKIPF